MVPRRGVDRVRVQPTGLALSPDLTKLYVASFQNSQIVAYDYNRTAGTASNPTVFAAGFADNLATPSSILFSQDGSTMYVSNLGGTGVARFNLDGSTAGPPLQFAAQKDHAFPAWIFRWQRLHFDIQSRHTVDILIVPQTPLNLSLRWQDIIRQTCDAWCF